ncbi:MAG: hypothetical protein ACFFD1_03700 [Candidatus Thorarchaeota archaeon]
MNDFEYLHEVHFQNSKKVFVGIEDNKLVLKNSDNEIIHLELDPIAIPYLFNLCVTNLIDTSHKLEPITIPAYENKINISKEVSKQKNFILTKKQLSYDQVFDLISSNNKIESANYTIDLTDDEWREILLEIYRSRKTYAGEIIKNLQIVGLPINDVQIGRVLKRMRDQGFIRGTERHSKKTGNLYYLLEFPPYIDDGDQGD